MLLYDVGNTHIKRYHDGVIERVETFDTKRPFYYISVNKEQSKFLQNIPHATDLSDQFAFHTAYKGIGVDRIAACYTVDNGVVVDAGSAITIDVMREGRHEGGFIMPGLRAYKESFANISAALDYELNTSIIIDALPQNTRDALSYATVKSIYLMIQDTAQELPLLFCGGDGEILSHYFDNSQFKNTLVFEGMKKVIKEMKC